MQALRLAITLALLGLLAFIVADPREVGRAIAGLRWPAALAALALTTGDRVLMAVKWWMLLRARRVALPLATAVRAYFASSFAGLLLPVTVGADAIRVVAVRQFGVYDVTASIIIERTLGALGMLAVAFVGCALLAEGIAGVSVESLTLALGLMLLLLAAAFPASLWMAARRQRWPAIVPGAVTKIAEAYAAYARHRGVLIAFALLSMAESVLPSVTTYVVALGLGFDVPFWLFLATVPIALTVARLPISLGGFGVQEVSFVYLAGLLGMNASDALATMLVSGAVLLVTLIPAAFDVPMLSMGRRSA